MMVPAYNPRSGGAEGGELQMPSQPRLYSKALSSQNKIKTSQTKKTSPTLEKAAVVAHHMGMHELLHIWVSRPQAGELDPDICHW